MAGQVLAMGPDADLWLPPEFPVDEDLFFCHHGETKKSASGSAAPLPLSTEFPYDNLSSLSSSSSSSSSNPSSPVDSATESEGQSDDDLDDYLAGLTIQMAHSFLQEADDDTTPASNAAAEQRVASAAVPAGSPGVWASSEAAFETSKAVPTPSMNDDAAQVWRINPLNHREVEAAGGPALPPWSEGRRTFNGSGANMCVGNRYYHYLKPPLTQYQLQFVQLQHLKQQQLVNRQLAAAAAASRRWNGSPASMTPEHHPPGVPWSAWPTLQAAAGGMGKAPHSPPLPPPPGSGMQAVFLPGGVGPKQPAGTGVFLPRRAGSSSSQARKKPYPACSTVLVPARVVHALNNLNLEAEAADTEAGGHGVGGGDGGVVRVGVGDGDTRVPVRAGGSYSDYYGGGNNNKKKKSCGGDQVCLRLRYPPKAEQQSPPSQMKQQPLAGPSLETRLPPEWTY